MMDRLVSVIIPVFNGERFLAEAIESVRAQSHEHWELLVINDGSTDATPEIVSRYPEARYLRQDHQGQARARNWGVELAAGEFIAFLDADDIWIPNKLKDQMNAFESDPGLDVVYGLAQVILEPGAGEPPGWQNAGSTLPSRLPSAMLVRKAAFLRVGGFDDSLSTAEGIEWCARAEHLGLRRRILEEVVYRRRIHDRNTARLTDQSRMEYLRTVREALNRAQGDAG
ncbi:glycosyltransferase family A protein [Gemmatimonadota bacterium]